MTHPWHWPQWTMAALFVLYPAIRTIRESDIAYRWAAAITGTVAVAAFSVDLKIGVFF